MPQYVIGADGEILQKFTSVSTGMQVPSHQGQVLHAREDVDPATHIYDHKLQRLLPLSEEQLQQEAEIEANQNEGTKLKKARFAYHTARLDRLSKALIKAREKLNGLRRCREQELKIARGSSGSS